MERGLNEYQPLREGRGKKEQDTLESYAHFLRGNAKELDTLYSDALISVTGFFRNPEAFDVLKRTVFPKLLQRCGDQPFRAWVLGCSTGQEAYSVAMAFVEAAENAPWLRPDVVLLDIGLPKMSGYDACRRIREQPWGKDMVLVAVTGWGQEEDRRKSKDAGFDAHLVKPVDYRALMKLLAALTSEPGGPLAGR